MKRVTPAEKIIIYKEAYLMYLRNPLPFGNYIGVIYDLGVGRDQLTGVSGEDLLNSTLVTVRQVVETDDDLVYALSPEATCMAILLHKSLTQDILKQKLVTLCKRNVARKTKQYGKGSTFRKYCNGE